MKIFDTYHSIIEYFTSSNREEQEESVKLRLAFRQLDEAMESLQRTALQGSISKKDSNHEPYESNPSYPTRGQ